MSGKPKKKQVLKLRPTQLCLGLEEVANKVHKMKRKKTKQLNNYLSTRVIPVVIGPNKEMYMIDHHHLARACWELGVKHIQVRVIDDLSHLSVQAFWDEMVSRSWVYPYDQFGIMTSHIEKNLPETIMGLADDPFRSLAWMVREKGGFNKVYAPFSEFRWGNFFRDNMKSHPRVNSYGACIKEALRLCRSAKAKSLPGYKP